jgi:hypothetical protein
MGKYQNIISHKIMPLIESLFSQYYRGLISNTSDNRDNIGMKPFLFANQFQKDNLGP